MRGRGLVGPVFVIESLVASRRWQLYVIRAVFVAIMLACLSTIWSSFDDVPWMTAQQQLVAAGQSFYRTTVIVEFVLVLAASPAATAGAICLDKSRGSLAILFTTELTAAEVVVGKLIARLLPILGLLACALPVSALAVLMGGVDPVSLGMALLIAVGLALLGCTFTMLVSVWGTTPHEVLAAVYATVAAWLLPRFILDVVTRGASNRTLDVLRRADPFWIAIDSYGVTATSQADLIGRSALFFGIASLLSIVFTVLAIRSLRPAMIRMANRKARPIVETRAALRFRRDVPWWPSPSLDANPVLWREWHRSRPTRMMRIVWGLYLGTTGAASVLVIVGMFVLPRRTIPNELASLLIAFEAAFGFLLMSVTSATSLAEERARGSLDVLMTTPLPSRSIVWGKWRGTFRLTLVVLFWPILIAYAMAIRIMPDARLAAFYVILPYGIAWGAFVSSLGLALACWTKRLGRTVALAVSIYVALALGIPMLARGEEGEGWFPASPFWGMGGVSNLMKATGLTGGPFTRLVVFGALWAVVYAIAAVVLFGAIELTFEAALGRLPERPRPPWLSAILDRETYRRIKDSGSRIPGAGGRPGSDGGSFGRRPR